MDHEVFKPDSLKRIGVGIVTTSFAKRRFCFFFVRGHERVAIVRRKIMLLVSPISLFLFRV